MGNGWGEARAPSYSRSLFLLIGHLIGTALIFVAFLLLAWSISALLSYLHEVHPLPHEIFNYVTKLEAGIVYADSAFCGIVLLAGTWRFLRDLFQ